MSVMLISEANISANNELIFIFLYFICDEIGFVLSKTSPIFSVGEAPNFSILLFVKKPVMDRLMM